MWKRRLVFATPFVLVAGCKRPIEPDVNADRRPIAATHDAYLPLPEAPPIDAPERGAMTAEELAEFCSRPGASCNPPRPQMPPPDAAPASVVGKNLQVRSEGSPPRTYATIAGGSREGVARDWTGEIQLPGGRLVTFKLIRIEHLTSIAVIDLTRDQIRTPDLTVRLIPPTTP